ncbi:hypothetical protein C7B79_05745 [Chroococcidiopsis cubana CCALA 043]|nr:hypothetical protein [Chroococcidiopsis cubana]PSB65370.1 hypothetical protein C7B79_05745 [Chroococcidiopsis cubana CCALA 043]
MGLDSFVRLLYVPEDALRLRQGKLRVQKLEKYTLRESDVLEAAEIPIAINDAYNFFSQADVVERATSYGWMPELEESQSIFETELPAERESSLVSRKKGTPVSTNRFSRKVKALIFRPLAIIKRKVLARFRIHIHTLNSSQISKDLLFKLNHIHNARERIKQVSFSSDGGWVVLYERNGFLYSDISNDVIDKLWEFSHAGEEIKQVTFAPNGAWVILRNRCDFWQSNLPKRMFNQLWSSFNIGQEIKHIAIAANLGWIISSGQNTFSHSHIPDDMSDKLLEFRGAGEEIKQIAFAPNGGWVILRERNDFWYSNIPNDLINTLWKYHRSGREIRQISFAENSGWVVLGSL